MIIFRILLALFGFVRLFVTAWLLLLFLGTMVITALRAATFIVRHAVKFARRRIK